MISLAGLILYYLMAVGGTGQEADPADGDKLQSLADRIEERVLAIRYIGEKLDRLRASKFVDYWRDLLPEHFYWDGDELGN